MLRTFSGSNREKKKKKLSALAPKLDVLIYIYIKKKKIVYFENMSAAVPIPK